MASFLKRPIASSILISSVSALGTFKGLDCLDDSLRISGGCKDCFLSLRLAYEPLFERDLFLAVLALADNSGLLDFT